MKVQLKAERTSLYKDREKKVIELIFFSNQRRKNIYTK